jgi:tetratricopeptide (TPR) repeat protein
MSRKVSITLVLSLVVFISGCIEEWSKDDPRFRADPAEAAIAADKGFAAPDAAEIDLVERMAIHRGAYQAALAELVEYYTTSGDATKLGWAKKEQASLVQYRYLMPAEAMQAALAATDSIEEADKLFEEANGLYWEANRLMVIADEDKLRMALRGFNKLITNYPTSDKIDDAAYRAGQVYEHFGDYQIAAVYYQRAFQWDDGTPYPARFKAAYVLDKHLHMRKEALALYRLAVERESRFDGNTEFAQRRIGEMTRDEAKAPK